MNSVSRFDKRITDAKDDVVIHVKLDDIKKAVCKDHQKCAIAKAILRQRGSTTKWVDVGNSVVLIGTGARTGKRYLLKGEAREQVKFFDTQEGRMAPCSVVLAAPATSKRPLGARKGEAGGKKNKPSKRAKPTR